ncbi:MAG: aminoglycoside phosphotransferase family protein [Solirubrobacteraceae bacterium]
MTLGAPYQPGGHCAWVAPARNSAGDELVLKLAWRHYESEQEADGLRAWNGDGAVRVFAADAWDDCSALLLERCRPGKPLGSSVSEPAQDLVIAGLLGRLWRIPVDVSRFRPLQSMCDAWATSFERRVADSPPALDPGLVRAGIELFRSLPASAARRALLTTDLHAENVLAAEREPWLMIDPKPYYGDPAYDVLQHMLNCDRLGSDPRGLARRLAQLLELDPRRVLQWLFARCVQESIDAPALAQVASVLAPAAL